MANPTKTHWLKKILSLFLKEEFKVQVAVSSHCTSIWTIDLNTPQLPHVDNGAGRKTSMKGCGDLNRRINKLFCLQSALYQHQMEALVTVMVWT